MGDDHAEPEMSIGEFARRTRLTTKALRVYDRIGLLPPANIDEDSRYRRYRVSQVRRGQLIALMRGADLSLSDIGLILGDLAAGEQSGVERLKGLAGQIDRRHKSRRLLIGHIQAMLQQGEDPMFEVSTRHVPARRLMSIQRRLHGDQTDAFARDAKAAFVKHLDGANATGPFTLIFHGPVNADEDGPLEAVVGCPDDVLPTDLIGVRTEPAHDEAYTTITKAQWDYPAILAAYDAVASSSEVAARPNSPLSCREVYIAEPDEIEENDLICDIAYPLAEKTAGK